MASPSATLPLASALGLVLLACSEIAGFDRFTGPEESEDATPDDDAARSGSGGAWSGGASGAVSFGGSPRGGTTTGGTSNGTPEAGGAAGGANTAGASGSMPSGGSSPAPNGGAGGVPNSGASAGDSSMGGTSAGADGGEQPGAAGEGGAIGGCDRQLIANADFDRGRRVWTESSNFAPNFQIIKPGSDAGLVALGVTPRSGDYLAWLSGLRDDDFEKYRTTLSQRFSVPADVGRLELSGYVWIVSEETSEHGDEMVAEIYDADDTFCWLAHTWTSAATSSGWVHFEYSTSDDYQLNCMRGKTVELHIEGRQDWTGKTSFFLDSLRVAADCGN